LFVNGQKKTHDSLLIDFVSVLVLGENYYKGDLVLFLLFFSTAHTLAKKNYSKIVSASYE